MPEYKQETRPRYLYKYMRADQYARMVFANRQVYFNTPLGLNDPFDCSPIYTTDCTRAQFLAHLRRNFRRQKPALSAAELERMVHAVSYPPKRRELRSWLNRYRRRMAAIGIYSTSARGDSILMWSHYADDHKGICLVLDTAKLAPNVLISRVKYSSKRRVVNLFRDSDKANVLVALYKNREWSYEEEWRIALETKPGLPRFPCAVDVPSGFVSAVILGARLVPRKTAKIVQWIEMLTPRPGILRAAIGMKEYRVEVSSGAY